MNVKRIATLVLVLFVVVSVAYLIIGEFRRGGNEGSAYDEAGRDIVPGEKPSGSGAPVDEPAPDGEVSGGEGSTDIPAHDVVVYYFHGKKRCRTCLAIEAYTKEAIVQGFPEQLEAGVLGFHAVDVDEPENEHFIVDYELTTKSVILSDRRGGAEERWKNLSLVWEYVGDKEVFIDYVRRETEEYLGELAHE